MLLFTKKNLFEKASGNIAEIAFLCFQLERAVFMLFLVRNFGDFAKFRQI